MRPDHDQVRVVANILEVFLEVLVAIVDLEPSKGHVALRVQPAVSVAAFHALGQFDGLVLDVEVVNLVLNLVDLLLFVHECILYQLLVLLVDRHLRFEVVTLQLLHSFYPVDLGVQYATAISLAVQVGFLQEDAALRIIGLAFLGQKGV